MLNTFLAYFASFLPSKNKKTGDFTCFFIYINSYIYLTKTWNNIIKITPGIPKIPAIKAVNKFIPIVIPK